MSTITILDNTTRTEYLSFINSEDIEFNITPPNYLLTGAGCFGLADLVVHLSKAPYQDGRTLIDKIYEEREFNIEFTIFASDKQALFDRRLNVINHFSPDLGLGQLKWSQADGGEYYLDCLVSKIEFPQGSAQGTKHQKVLMHMVAPNPFWYDPGQIERTLVGFSGGWTYPWSFPMSYGQVGTTIEIANTGNVETPVMIYFYGELVDPVITNARTDEEISIVHTIPDGDILIINTAFGETAVRILSGGEYSNAFEYVDPDSIFWKLQPGSNPINYTVSSEGENAQCLVHYYNRFSGI